jgi:hypothetical protein
MQALVGLFVAISLSQAAPAATTGRIAGRVTVEGANTPIAGARIMLVPAGRPTGPIGMPPQATTDQDGRFVFDTLAPGEYGLVVQKTGFAPLLGPEARPSMIRVAAGQTVDGVSVQLQTGGVIAGKVLNPSGEPLTDAGIMAMRRINGPAGATASRFMPAPMQGLQQTNDLGEFRVSGLAPGEYYVAAMPRGAMAFGGPATMPGSTGNARTAITTTFYPGTTDQAAALPVVVAAGAEVGNIVFTMQSAPAFRVSGLVIDEDGQPVARAMVMLMGDPRSGMFMGPAGRAQTQDDGRFVIGDVPSGSYRITATVMMTVSNVSGGVSTGAFTSFSSGIIGGMERPTEVVVADADVTDVRVLVHRPPQ